MGTQDLEVRSHSMTDALRVRQNEEIYATKAEAICKSHTELWVGMGVGTRDECRVYIDRDSNVAREILSLIKAHAKSKTKIADQGVKDTATALAKQ